MVSCIKKISFAVILTASFYILFHFLTPSSKTDLFYMWFKTSNYVHYTFKKIFLSKPNPICYINDEKVLEKIKNPPAWVLKQIAGDFSAYKKFSKKDVEKTFEAFDDKNMLVKIVIEKGRVISINKGSTPLNGASEFGLSLYKAIFSYALKKKYIKNLSFLLRFTDFFSKVPSHMSIAN
jgi:hypothetical protein